MKRKTASPAKKQQDPLHVLCGRDKTGNRVYMVLSREKTIKEGYPVYHAITWDNTTYEWVCPCDGFKFHRACSHTAAMRDFQKVQHEIYERLYA